MPTLGDMMFKLPIAVVTAVSLGTSAMAATPENCVSEAEATAVFAAVMPDIIDGLRDKCAAHLPANAYIVRNADDLVARYKILADQRWPEAKLAFGKIAGDVEMGKKMPDEFFRPLIGSVIGAKMFEEISPGDCSGASRVVESLAPLPAENVSMLIGAVLTMADKGKGSKMPVCKGSAG
jgi:hypothetical protein